jgi:predicted esterase
MTSVSPYLLGKTPSFACEADPRFSYCLHVPRAAGATKPARMLVAMHDTLRNNQALRDLFSDYAEHNNVIVVAPLFPATLASAPELDHYKYIRARDVRYDDLVVRMTEEVARCYGMDAARFDLFGFSGGGHFAHRFLYVQPERLSRLVVASPGSVTLPVEDYPWWPGLGDFEKMFGHPVEWGAAKRVEAHLVVGALDTNPGGIIQSRDHPKWVEGADAAGANRVERLKSLHQRLQRRGVKASFEELPEVAHEIGPVVEAAIRFLESA